MRPNADNTDVGFADSRSDLVNSYGCVNEVVVSPNAPTIASYYMVSAGDETDAYQIWGITAASDDATTLRVYIYGYKGPTGVVVSADIYVNGGWLGQQTLPLTAETYEWAYFDFNGSWTQAQLNDALLKVRKQAGGGAGTGFDLNNAYVDANPS